MNHRLKFRWEPNGFDNLALQEVWCPGDHGGVCDFPEVDFEDHDEMCDLVIYASEMEAEPMLAGCSCEGKPTGECWAKENLGLFVAAWGGWQECLRGSIDLPWVAVTISGPGPDGNEELFVDVVAEMPAPMRHP